MMKMIWVSHHDGDDDDDGDEDELEEGYDDIINSNDIENYNHIDDGNKNAAQKSSSNIHVLTSQRICSRDCKGRKPGGER